MNLLARILNNYNVFNMRTNALFLRLFPKFSREQFDVTVLAVALQLTRELTLTDLEFAENSFPR